MGGLCRLLCVKAAILYQGLSVIQGSRGSLSSVNSKGLMHIPAVPIKNASLFAATFWSSLSLGSFLAV